MGVGTLPKLFSKMWVLFRELTHDQEKKQIMGFFVRASKEWSEKSTDTLIQFLFLKTVYTSMHRTCIPHRYIEIRNSSCRPFNKVPPWLKKTLVRYAVGYMLHFILGHFVPVEERVVSFGNMPCQMVGAKIEHIFFLEIDDVYFLVWKIMMNRIVGNSDWWSEFSTPQSRNCFPLLRSMLYVTLLN